MENEFEFTDRYIALGRPDPETMCKGQCKGTGVYPTKQTDATDVEIQLWTEAHNAPGAHEEDRPCNGWHFIRCPDCSGTGKACNKGEATALRKDAVR